MSHLTVAAVIGIAGIALSTAADAAVTVTQANLSAGSLNLTTAGATDWVKLGSGTDASFRAEKAGASNIGTITGGPTGFIQSSWTSYPTAMSWTDGDSPNTVGTGVVGSLEAKSPSGSDPSLTTLTFDVTGLNGAYQMLVYGSAYRSAYKFTATLSGGGGSSNVTGSKANAAGVLYTIDFTATAGQVLSVTYEQTSDNVANADDNIGIGGIALAAVPEPSSVVLLSLGLVGLLGRRSR